MLPTVIPRPDGSGIEAPEADGWDADVLLSITTCRAAKWLIRPPAFYIARQGALTRKVFIR